MTEDRAREAVRLRGEGLSVRQIAKQLGASKSTVQRWLAAAPEEPPPAAAPRVTAAAGTRAMLDAVVSTAELVHERALAGHEAAVAGRAVVDLANASAITARVETVAVDGLEMSAAEITETIAGIYQAARELVAPTLCPKCGSQLTMAELGLDMPVLADAAPLEHAPNPALARAAEVFDLASATVDSALADGNVKAAQRANRNCTDAVRVYARVEREERQRRTEQTYFFPAAETDKNLEEIYARAEILRGVQLCPSCGVRQRMAAVGAVSALG